MRINKNLLVLLFLLIPFSSNIWGQQDSTFIRENILTSVSGDSFFHYKKLLLEQIPELTVWDEMISKRSDKQASLIAFIDENDFSTSECEHCFTMIYVGENHPAHTVRIVTFLIDNSTNEILVYDLISEGTKTLGEWRKDNSTLNRYE